jgi:hypothetical protein
MRQSGKPLRGVAHLDPQMPAMHFEQFQPGQFRGEGNGKSVCDIKNQTCYRFVAARSIRVASPSTTFNCTVNSK